MQRLVERIRSEFGLDMIIEVYVLDNNGDPFELFTGLPDCLNASHFQVMLKESGCFYVFSIVGIDKSLADSVDIQLQNIVRKEFCWLTGMYWYKIIYSYYCSLCYRPSSA